MLQTNRIIKNNRIIYDVYNFLRNGFWKKGLDVEVGERTRIEGIKVKGKGKENKIYIGKNVRICNCQIVITGNNNIVHIEDGCSLRGTGFYIEDNDNVIDMGEGTTTTNAVDICAIEGTKISIGKDCMISSNIYISTGDGHPVCDTECRLRTNLSQNIEIEDHVWIGTRVIIGKGCQIGKNSIVAAGSVCTSGFLGEKQENVIIGGNPARIVKGDINWMRERIIKQDLQ